MVDLLILTINIRRLKNKNIDFMIKSNSIMRLPKIEELYDALIDEVRDIVIESQVEMSRIA